MNLECFQPWFKTLECFQPRFKILPLDSVCFITSYIATNNTRTTPPATTSTTAPTTTTTATTTTTTVPTASDFYINEGECFETEGSVFNLGSKHSRVFSS
jgi:hypothetical protein